MLMCIQRVPNTRVALNWKSVNWKSKLVWPVLLSRPPLTLSQCLIKHSLLPFIPSSILGVKSKRNYDVLLFGNSLSADNGFSFPLTPNCCNMSSFPLGFRNWIFKLNVIAIICGV